MQTLWPSGARCITMARELCSLASISLLVNQAAVCFPWLADLRPVVNYCVCYQPGSMKSKELITVVSHPRSGSSYFVFQARKIREIRGMLEIFHNDEAIIESHLEDLFDPVNKRFGNYSQSLRQRVEGSPLSYIELIQQQIEQVYLLFKIFPGHLPDDKLKLLVRHSDHVIFFLRNVLHSFISNKISKKLNCYSDVDTSEVKVTFTPREFIWWTCYICRHFDAAGFSPDEQSSLIHYEQLSACESAPAWLARHLQAQFGHAFTFTDEGHLPLRQDSRADACDKVSNPKEMTAWLEQHDLTYLIDASQSSNYADLLRLVEQAG
jgi:hypothetical protein